MVEDFASRGSKLRWNRGTITPRCLSLIILTSRVPEKPSATHRKPLNPVTCRLFGGFRFQLIQVRLGDAAQTGIFDGRSVYLTLIMMISFEELGTSDSCLVGVRDVFSVVPFSGGKLCNLSPPLRLMAEKTKITLLIFVTDAYTDITPSSCLVSFAGLLICQ